MIFYDCNYGNWVILDMKVLVRVFLMFVFKFNLVY